MTEKQNSHQISPQGTRIDPDPFVVFLGILSAVGSVTSIASYIEQKREHYASSMRLSDKRRAHDELLKVDQHLSRIRHEQQTTESMIPTEMHDLDFVFGAALCFDSAQQFKEYASAVKSLFRSIKDVQTAVLNMISVMYRTSLDWEDSPLRHLIKVRELCNEMLATELTYGDALGRLAVILKETQAATAALREWLLLA